MKATTWFRFSWTLLLLAGGTLESIAQYREYGVNLFSTVYLGDLTHANTFAYSTRGGIGAHFRRHLTRSLSLRADVNFAVLAGADNSPRLRRLSADAYNDSTGRLYRDMTLQYDPSGSNNSEPPPFGKDQYFYVDSFSQTVTGVRGDVHLRNLSFRSLLSEFAVVAEYKFGEFMINSSVTRSNFYVFGGIHVYNFLPYARSAVGSITGWANLKDITTEGQGLDNSYKVSEYKSTQLGIPLGLGVRWTLDKYTRFAAELGYRILFTDYLDDVGGSYANPAVIGSVHGAGAAEFVDRTRQLHPWLKPNLEGTLRGDPKGRNDGYLFLGVSLSRVIFPYDCPQL